MNSLQHKQLASKGIYPLNIGGNCCHSKCNKITKYLFVLKNIWHWANGIYIFFIDHKSQQIKHFLNLKHKNQIERTKKTLALVSQRAKLILAIHPLWITLVLQFFQKSKTTVSLLLLSATSGEKGKKGLPPAHGICYALHVIGKLITAIPDSLLPKLLRIAELVQLLGNKTAKHNADLQVWLSVYTYIEAQMYMPEWKQNRHISASSNIDNTVLLYTYNFKRLSPVWIFVKQVPAVLFLSAVGRTGF